MVNAAVAVYYYLRLVRDVIFGDPVVYPAPIELNVPTRILCVTLIVVIIALGVASAPLMDAINHSLSEINASVVTTLGP